MISVPPLQTRCPKCLDWVEIPVIVDQTLNSTTLHITLKPDMTRPLSGLPLPSNSPAEIETTWRELVAEWEALKSEISEAWDVLPDSEKNPGHTLSEAMRALIEDRDFQSGRALRAIAEWYALKAEIGAAWEAAPDGYEADSLAGLIKRLAFVAEGESEIQRADPPQPYIDGALAWLASIEDELDTMDAMQLWGRMFGWLEAQR